MSYIPKPDVPIISSLGPVLPCYCTFCRKTEGGQGYGINLGGDDASLEVEGRDRATGELKRTGTRLDLIFGLLGG